MTFDATALTEPVDRAAVRAYASRLRAQGFDDGSLRRILTFVAVGVAVLIFVPVFGSVVVTVVSSFARAGSGGVFTVIPILMVVFALGVAGLAVWGLVRGGAGAGVRRYRLDRFARANGMSFVPALADPPLPGMIFDLGSARSSSDLVRGDRPRFVEFANYRYTTGSGKERTVHQWGYVAVRLDTPLPHIVLDALSNNGLFGNLPEAFDRDQRLSLEGDFDQHFALYCPRGYERDALYLFTPDVMARFIDNAAALDVEIVDDWLFLYAKRDLSTLDPATWAWLFGAVGALLDKLGQWGRWRDEHLATDASSLASTAAAPGNTTGAASVASALPFAAPSGLLTPPPAGVAAQGRRLQRRTPVAAIGVMVVFVALWIAMQTGLLDRLFGG
ncbi:hypothetical protein [Microbacterium sp. CJ88]|uniref:hypothetical protein n=1 Tax=Microbacterium sp. CJ88 TaxID=3445672 RepID=UPI003F658AF1